MMPQREGTSEQDTVSELRASRSLAPCEVIDAVLNALARRGALEPDVMHELRREWTRQLEQQHHPPLAGEDRAGGGGE